ncbi:hypothetical protein N7489_004836 [Penicillium chrysogenum]|uniref:uncharacterized protein n=1 Tax=Penicillium chrysogenum TaxID=5076 RepID=UPI0024DF116B|nr:uncharacterized protein N7489_004836 [Penicillium chrysogenum]KAJ5244740.1 hypothetical protein N7489_004836 [Penicillium chrysogenum]
MYKFASVNNISTGLNHSSAEPHPEVPQNDLTPSTSVLSHAYVKGYSVLLSSRAIKRPTRFMKRLSVRKGDITYEMLGYPRDDIGSLRNDVLDTASRLIVCIAYNVLTF